MIALLGSVQVPVASANTPVPEDGYYDCATGVKRADSDWTGFRIDEGNVKNIDCTGHVLLPNGLTSIESYAFMGSALTSITIPSSVTSIGYMAFSQTESLTSIDIPSSVTSIGEGAFSGAKSLTSIIIPEGVTSIANSTFLGATALASVTIPSSVTSIGDSAFHSTKSLTAITIPSSVTSILARAFYEASSLTSITIPASVTSIGSNVFYGTTSLTDISVDSENPSYTSIDGVLFTKSEQVLMRYPAGITVTSYTIPSSVKKLGSYSFAGVTALTSITMPESLTSIDEAVFEDATALISVNIPEGVKYIGERAFKDASALTSVSIPSTVTTIGDKAFAYTTSLTSINIPSSVTKIGSYAFLEATALTSIIVPQGVTSIGEGTFAYATALTSVTIPDSVTLIDYFAFEGATALESINIPASVKTLNDWAFWGAPSLKDVYFLGNAPDYIGDDVFYKIAAGAKAHITAKATGFGTEPTWNGLTVERATDTPAVPENGFYDCATGVKLAESEGKRYSIYNGAVSNTNCSGAVVLPEGVTSIQESGFYYGELTSINIPSSVQSIGDYAFTSSKLASITIQEGLTSIGKQAFQYSELTSINIPSTVRSIGTNVFASAPITSVTIQEGLTSIGTAVFNSATKLQSITIPRSVTSIGSAAFFGTALTSVTIPSGVTSIGARAFWGNESLTSISVESANQNYASVDGVLYDKNKTTLIQYPAASSRSTYNVLNTVTSIGERAFAGATELTSVTIPSSVTSIGSSAFRAATALTSIVIPQGVTSINPQTFEAATALTSVIIPDSVTIIDAYSFSGASSLASITIPASVETIEEGAFDRATSLKDVYFLGNAPSKYVDSYAFDRVAAGAKAQITATATGFGTEATWNGLVLERAIANYAVTYNSGSGGSVASGTFTTGGSIQTAPVSTRIGYKLVGWSTSPTGTVVSFPYTPTVSADITLHAIWETLAVKPSYVSGAKLTGAVKVGKAITVTKGTWKGTAAIAYTYQWYVCKSASTKVLTTGKVAPKCTLVKKALKFTSPTYKPTAKDKGGYLAVLITGINKTGKSVIFTSTSGKVS